VQDAEALGGAGEGDVKLGRAVWAVGEDPFWFHDQDGTATGGPGTGWNPHELRHSGLTHLGEAGASLVELMAKSRPPQTGKPAPLLRAFDSERTIGIPAQFDGMRSWTVSNR
jgi:hypothetical protein